MLIVRSVCENDLDSLFNLVQKSEFGLTTLKISKSELESRIERAQFAFRQKAAKPNGLPYVFVMEDLDNGEIVGTSSIYSKVGGFEPFYSYEIKKSIHRSEELGVEKEIDVLHLLEEHDGPTEIGSLFLSPEYWGGGHGRLLSLARFLFLADFPDRFENEIIAEMRGVVDENGRSPLWAALGSYFFQMDFPKAETLTSQSKKLIADLMPTHPIYIPLLPQDAREAIGKVHQNTEPALAMLEKEGFKRNGLVDIFDGGPTVACSLSEIRAVRKSQSGNVGAIVENLETAPEKLLSNSSLDYRACLGKVVWNNNGATIEKPTASMLELKLGDPIRAVRLKPNRHESSQQPAI